MLRKIKLRLLVFYQLMAWVKDKQMQFDSGITFKRSFSVAGDG
jgi:hypothetical protein